MIKETSGFEETFELGEKLGKEALPGNVYALIGDLGVGKTVFAQGFAKGLGIKELVNSPTFTILNIYEGGRLRLCHFDVYRIEDPSEMEEIGYDEYFFGDGVCLVEWADIIEELLPEDTIYIKIEKNLEKGMDHRLIEINAG